MLVIYIYIYIIYIYIGGAEYGIAPWKLGMLSALLLLWDVMWGTIVPDYNESNEWLIRSHHVYRAHDFLMILMKIRSVASCCSYRLHVHVLYELYTHHTWLMGHEIVHRFAWTCGEIEGKDKIRSTQPPPTAPDLLPINTGCASGSGAPAPVEPVPEERDWCVDSRMQLTSMKQTEFIRRLFKKAHKVEEPQDRS